MQEGGKSMDKKNKREICHIEWRTGNKKYNNSVNIHKVKANLRLGIELTA